MFEDDALVLKSHVPRGGGLHPGGIESGILRALMPVTPRMVVEMRAKLPHGLGTWPAFWLNPVVEYPAARFSATPWPPEIDIFEFFQWQRARSSATDGKPRSDGGRSGETGKSDGSGFVRARAGRCLRRLTICRPVTKIGLTPASIDPNPVPPRFFGAPCPRLSADHASNHSRRKKRNAHASTPRKMPTTTPRALERRYGETGDAAGGAEDSASLCARVRIGALFWCPFPALGPPTAAPPACTCSAAVDASAGPQIAAY